MPVFICQHGQEIPLPKNAKELFLNQLIIKDIKPSNSGVFLNYQWVKKDRKTNYYLETVLKDKEQLFYYDILITLLNKYEETQDKFFLQLIYSSIYNLKELAVVKRFCCYGNASDETEAKEIWEDYGTIANQLIRKFSVNQNSQQSLADELSNYREKILKNSEKKNVYFARYLLNQLSYKIRDLFYVKTLKGKYSTWKMYLDNKVISHKELKRGGISSLAIECRKVLLECYQDKLEKGELWREPSLEIWQEVSKELTVKFTMFNKIAVCLQQAKNESKIYPWEKIPDEVYQLAYKYYGLEGIGDNPPHPPFVLSPPYPPFVRGGNRGRCAVYFDGGGFKDWQTFKQLSFEANKLAPFIQNIDFIAEPQKFKTWLSNEFENALNVIIPQKVSLNLDLDLEKELEEETPENDKEANINTNLIITKILEQAETNIEQIITACEQEEQENPEIFLLYYGWLGQYQSVANIVKKDRRTIQSKLDKLEKIILSYSVGLILGKIEVSDPLSLVEEFEKKITSWLQLFYKTQLKEKLVNSLGKEQFFQIYQQLKDELENNQKLKQPIHSDTVEAVKLVLSFFEQLGCDFSQNLSIKKCLPKASKLVGEMIFYEEFSQQQKKWIKRLFEKCM